MKKMISLILAAVMSLSLLAGCASSEPAPSEEETAPETEVAAPEAEEATTRVVVDDTGREIVVPAQIDRIAIISTITFCLRIFPFSQIS